MAGERFFSKEDLIDALLQETFLRMKEEPLPEVTSTEEVERRPRRTRAIVGAVWLALFASLIIVGLFSDFTVERTATWVRAAGVWGIVGYLLAFALLQPLGLSGNLLTIAAALIWDWWFAIPLALAGAVSSAITCFVLARYVAFDWVQARLPRRLRKFERWLVDRGLLGVIGFRVLTFTAQVAMLMMGTTRIRFSTMLVGTIIGFTPLVCVDVLLGGELMRYLLDALGVS